jgi:hypothetical protein
MVKLLAKFFLLLTVLSSLVSCAMSPDPMEMLDSSTRSYERAIRWGGFQQAKSFHKNSPVLSDIERRRMKFYRVTGYNVLQHNTPDKFNSHLLVEIKYYKNDMPVVKTIVTKQHWKRDKESEVWYLESDFPKFK